jgi:hypothetical protein
MKLRVHSWGGLGSQLFALSILFDLKNRFPNRKILLIHHTSGISRRLFELESILDPSFKLITTDDYKLFEHNKIKSSYKRKTKFFFTHKFKILLERNKLIINYDRYNNLDRLKPWTIMIRGHYSDTLISKDFYSYCINKFKNIKTNGNSNSLIIHYRLGDLINLSGKSIIAPKDLIEKIKIVLREEDIEKILIYSDSIEEAQRTLLPINMMIREVEFSSAPTIDVVRNSINAKYFIGTNSKVSIWIIKFRDHLGLPSKVLKY